MHLADLDAEALRWWVRQQRLSGSDRIFMHSGVDLTGIAGHCSRWKPANPPREDELREAIAIASAHTWPFVAAPFDVAASIGLLSQLVETLILALGADHPRFLELMAAMRNRHLGLMMQAVRPGGCAVLVTKIVSSDSCPELTKVAVSDLPDLLRRSVDAGNFFTGLNSAVLRSMWRQSPELAPLTAKLQVAGPWLWDFGPRIYTCCAFCAVRR